MTRGCMMSLAFWIALSAGYYYWLSDVFDPPGSILGAIVVGFLVWICIGSLLTARSGTKIGSLLADNRRAVPPEDGRMVALSGTIEPLGKPVCAPFSGADCVMCEYQVADRDARSTDSRQDSGYDYAGFLMNPCAVSSPWGPVRLLGFPMLDGFDEIRCSSYAAAHNALEFFDANQFEDRTRLKVFSLLSVLSDVLCDEDGEVRKHIMIRNTPTEELFPPSLLLDLARRTHGDDAHADQKEEYSASEGLEEDDDDSNLEFGDGEAADDNELGLTAPLPVLDEKRVDIGERVCVVGVYNEMKKALVAPGGVNGYIQMIRGTAEDVRHSARSKARRHLLGGVIGLIVLHAGVFGLMQAKLHSEEFRHARNQQAFNAAKQGDVAVLDWLFKRHLDINGRDSDRRTMLMVADHPAVAAWLIQHGADVNAVDSRGRTAVFHAARQGNTAILKQLIDAKADLNHRDTANGHTALIDADEARQEQSAAMLRQAGAEDDVVTAETGEPLPEDGGPVLAACIAYLEAIHASDVPRLLSVTWNRRAENYGAADWDLWHKVHLVEIAAMTGFTRGDRATITLEGTAGEGFTTSWTYQLRREGDDWKIVREHWNTP